MRADDPPAGSRPTIEISGDAAVPVSVAYGPSRSGMDDPTGWLLLHAAHADVRELGPGPAAVLWCQGCGLGCPGCMSPATFERSCGRWAARQVVAEWLAGTPHVCLTLSGGEPMDQAPGLAALIDEIRRDRDWVVTCYTGYRREALERSATAGVRDLLERLDLLVDGRYVRRLHRSLLWRGSSNQRIHNLSGRVELPSDRSVGFAPYFDADGGFRLVGVPPVPGVVDAFTGAARTAGFEPTGGAASLPFASVPFSAREEA